MAVCVTGLDLGVAVAGLVFFLVWLFPAIGEVATVLYIHRLPRTFYYISQIYFLRVLTSVTTSPTNITMDSDRLCRILFGLLGLMLGSVSE